MLAVLARALEQAQEKQESSIKDGNSCLAKENSSGMMLPPRWLGMREVRHDNYLLRVLLEEREIPCSQCKHWGGHS